MQNQKPGTGCQQVPFRILDDSVQAHGGNSVPCINPHEPLSLHAEQPFIRAHPKPARPILPEYPDKAVGQTLLRAVAPEATMLVVHKAATLGAYPQ